MKKRNVRLLLMTTILILISNVTSFAAEQDMAVINAQKYGILTLLPPLVAIILAFITKNVIVSLVIGVMSGGFLLNLNGINVFSALFNSFLDLIDRAVGALADPWNAGIILQVLAIGGVINLVAKMGGAKAIAESLAKKAKSAKSAQLITWAAGLLVFFDDYANSLIIGPMMRPVTDKMKVSRERLAFVIDATAAPVAGIAIISTWIGLEVGLIGDGFKAIGVNANAFSIFLSTLPYRFYNILILGFIVITAVLLKEFGPMREAELKARRGNTNLVSSKDIDEKISNEHSDLEPLPGVKLNIWNAIIPIGILIVGSLVAFYYSGYSTIMSGNDASLIQIFNNSPLSFVAIREAFSNADASVALFQSALFAGIVAIAMGVGKKIFTVSQGLDIWVDGMKTLVITCVILICAWSLSSVIKELGTARYLIQLLSGSVPAFLLPSIIFVLGGIISFATGTSYGTMGILMPLTIPLAHSISPDMSYIIVCVSAVLTGSIFGDHCSPISDTTILSSMGAGCNHIDHVRTQMPYALFVGSIAILFGYIPAGMGLPIYLIMPLAFVAMFIGIQILGKSVDIDEKEESLIA
ncbi:MAG: Na+/H+ antiporter NhaC family protein [Terrisporobacter othiniensis]|uniref:Na+/H+ antiporter NhaC family protein n=1 Tax=Terrisporobacter petrolearius TaxID=1460447 RepID=UPI0022E1F2C3|nr:Na+/H+ antiporter NhaC family protein [Terrisporobacter petrolearius]MDU4862890.1 Na+/H+ antiporter NhaC family protein [Terrisporobacter othiniensis]MDU6995398.1 Na+/H+ antiporter NhaC family protein [Terrisporobacter othiniensis]